MNIKKIVLSFAILCFLPYLQSCTSGADASVNSNIENAVAHENETGVQQDILYQQTVVINDDETYSNFLLSIPTMSSDAPFYDFSEITLVTVITDVEGCSFYPLLDSVVETDKTIKISITNELETSLETCNPAPTNLYEYFLVSFSKTNKPISVIIENE